MEYFKGMEDKGLVVMEGVKGGHDGMSASEPKRFRKKKQAPETTAYCGIKILSFCKS